MNIFGRKSFSKTLKDRKIFVIGATNFQTLSKTVSAGLSKVPFTCLEDHLVRKFLKKYKLLPSFLLLTKKNFRITKESSSAGMFKLQFACPEKLFSFEKV